MHPSSIPFRALGLAIFVILCSFIACSGGGGASGSSGTSSVTSSTTTSPVTTGSAILLVSVDPGQVSIAAGSTQQFHATVQGSGSFSTDVVWTALKGTITATGLYTAPAGAASDVVTAASAQDPARTSQVQVTLTAGSAQTVSLELFSPSEVQMGSGPYTATARVSSGLSTVWSVQGGTLVSSSATSATFKAGSAPIITLAGTVAGAAGSVSSQRQIIALPFAPRSYLGDLKAHLAAFKGAIAGEVASGDAATWYFTSYYLHGMAAAADATEDAEVADQLVATAIRIIDQAQPCTYQGRTASQLPPMETDGMPQQLMTFQITGALARTAAIIATHPVFKAKYGAELGRLTAFIDQSIFKFWFDKSTGLYRNPSGAWQGGDVPWLPTSLGGWGTYAVWDDKCSHFGMISTWMYQATGGSLYREYATRVAKAFRTHVTVRNGAWIWDLGTVPIQAGENLQGSPDTSHANREPMMVVAMFENGIEFQLADVQGLAATLTDVIWNQSETDPRFVNYIDGGNLGFRTIGPWEDGNVYLGWNTLGRYSAKAQRVLALAYQAIMTQSYSSMNPSLKSNGNSYGKVELAGTLARNIVP